MQGSIGFLGAGAMAEAIIKGLLDGKCVSPAAITACDIAADRLTQLRKLYGIQTTLDREEFLAGADTVILAFKPQNTDAALTGIQVDKTKLVISIVAGITTDEISGYLGGEIPVIRAVPNTPCLVGEGMTVLAANNYVQDADLEKGLAVFRSVGSAIVLPEAQLDAVTGLSGSGPAYIYTVIEALADAGVYQGLSRQTALELAARTVLGAARMVLETGEHPGVLKDKVTSPAGTTITGLAVLEERGFRGTIIRAVEAASLRAKSLRKETRPCRH